MKRAWISFVLALFVSTSTFAALPGNCAPWVTTPCYHGGFNFGLGLLLWRPNSDNLEYAIRFPRFFSSTNLNPIPEDASFERIKPFAKGCLLYSLGYLFPCSNKDITLQGVNFNHHYKDRAINATNGFLLFAIFPASNLIGTTPNGIPSAGELTFFAPTFQFGTVGTVTNLFIPIPINLAIANAHFEDNVWDLELGRSFLLRQRAKLRFLLGLRYVGLHQKLEVDYQGVGTAPSQIVRNAAGDVGIVDFTGRADYRVVESSGYRGGGLKFGFNLSYSSCSGFGLVTEASGALLSGKINGELQQHLNYSITGVGLLGLGSGTTFTDNTFGSDLTQHLPNKFRFSPNFNAKIGLTYTYQFCYNFWSKVTAELGYRVDYFWNTALRVNAPGLISSSSPDAVIASGTFTTANCQVSATSLAGPYFNVQMQF